MGLSQILATNIASNVLSDDNGPWRQYILDHLDYISVRTKPSQIDRLLINQYRYDLARYLKDKAGIRGNIAWIVLLLNNIKSDFEFTEPGIYIIPTDDLINALYHSFITLETNSN